MIINNIVYKSFQFFNKNKSIHLAAQISDNLLKNYAVCSLQHLCYSTKSKFKTSQSPKYKFQLIYDGDLKRYIITAKMLSLTSSIFGIGIQPYIYHAAMSCGPVLAVTIYSMCGFFTILTPLLLHLLAKQYVIHMHYNKETDTYAAETLNFFGMPKKTIFTLDDVELHETEKLFSTFKAKGKALFVTGISFKQPNHFYRLTGHRSPIGDLDFKECLDDATKNKTTSNSN